MFTKEVEITIMDPQVRDVIEAALEDYVARLDDVAVLSRSYGDKAETARVAQQWARARCVLRRIKREGQL